MYDVCVFIFLIKLCKFNANIGKLSRLKGQNYKKNNTP